MEYRIAGSWRIHPKMPEQVMAAFYKQTEELLARSPNAWLSQHFAKPPARSLVEHIISGCSTFLSPDPFVDQRYYFGEDLSSEEIDRYCLVREMIQTQLRRSAEYECSTILSDKRELQFLQSLNHIRGDRIVKKYDAIVTSSPHDWDGKYEAIISVNFNTRDAIVAPTKRMLNYWK